MPAVAQISVNFAQLSQIRSNKITAPTNVRVVSPRTLTQYLLNNREQGDTVLSSPAYLNYQGGFISAGNKVNVKHDSDLQLRQNLDVEQRVFTDSIFARRKGNTAETYKDSRSSTAVRSITLAPYETDLTANSISITTTPSSKNIGLFMNFGNQGENSITLNNTTNDKKLNVRTGAFRIDAADLDIYGAPVYIDETVEIKKETTITDNLNVTGNLSLGTTSYNKFTIASATGNVAFTGNLNINTGKFTVASASGNTVIAGTLNVSGNTSIGGTTTLSNSITIGTGDTTSATRRIIGVRRLVNIAEFNTSTYDNDVLSVGDFKIFGFKTGMIMLWSGAIAGNLDGTNGLGVGPLLGWALCNGSNGTPDLRNRFVVGAGTGSSYTQGQADNRANANSHDHGGTNNYTLVNSDLPVTLPTGVTDNEPAHTHQWGGFTSVLARNGGLVEPNVLQMIRAAGCSEPADVRRYGELQERGAGGGEYQDSGVARYNVRGGGSHAHTVTLSNAGGNQGHKHTIPSIDHRPFWYALCYIMKL